MAWGWSPVGSNGATKRKSGTREVYQPPGRNRTPVPVAGGPLRSASTRCTVQRLDRTDGGAFWYHPPISTPVPLSRDWPRPPDRGRPGAAARDPPVDCGDAQRSPPTQPGRHCSTPMEMEYKDNEPAGQVRDHPGRRARGGRRCGVLLPHQPGADRRAGTGRPPVDVVVAAQVIPARTPIRPGAVVVREVPLDAATQVGIVTDPADASSARSSPCPSPIGQPIYSNMIASASGPPASRSSVRTKRSPPTPRPGAPSRSRSPTSARSPACSSPARRSTSSCPPR